jgi:hypothetical protein
MHRFASMHRPSATFASRIYLLPVISCSFCIIVFTQHRLALIQHALHVFVWVRVEANTFLLCLCYALFFLFSRRWVPVMSPGVIGTKLTASFTYCSPCTLLSPSHTSPHVLYCLISCDAVVSFCHTPPLAYLPYLTLPGYPPRTAAPPPSTEPRIVLHLVYHRIHARHSLIVFSVRHVGPLCPTRSWPYALRPFAVYELIIIRSD